MAAYIGYTNPKYQASGFSAAVCAALDLFLLDVQAGRRPILILQAPPQHGKSEIVSRKLPAYILGRFPDWRSAGSAIRTNWQTPWPKTCAETWRTTGTKSYFRNRKKNADMT